MRKIFSITIIALFLFSPLHAQFGLKDKLIKRTQDKIEKKVEDKIVEELSEELARMAFKPIENAMDDMLREAFEEQQGGEVDWEKSGAAYDDFLKGLNASASVPETYDFDLSVDSEIKDYDKEKHNVTMFFSKSKSYLGFRQYEKGKESTVVIDNENNAMVLYSHNNDGEKTAQAIPMMNALTNSMVQSMEQDAEDKNLRFNKINKQKKIAGYLSQGYEFESDTEKGEAWIAMEFPVNFFEIMSKGYSDFMPATYNETVIETKGMVMASDYENKDDKKIKSSFQVKKVTDKPFKIVNSDWGIPPKE